MIKWFLAYPIYVFENLNNPFPKSEQLVRHNSFNIFFLLLLGFIIYFVTFVLLFLVLKQINYFGIERRTVAIIIAGFINILILPVYLIVNYTAYVFLKENYIENFDLPKIKGLK